MNQLLIIGIITVIFIIGFYLPPPFAINSTCYNNIFENFNETNLNVDISNSRISDYNTISFETIIDSNADISNSKIPYYKTVSYEILTGYKLNSPNILPLTKYDTSYTSYYYDSNNYNVQYHIDYDNIMETTGIWVKNKEGKLEYIQWKSIPKYSTYYQPNTLKYGPSNYVPSYEDTVYLRNHTDKKKVVYRK